MNYYCELQILNHNRKWETYSHINHGLKVDDYFRIWKEKIGHIPKFYFKWERVYINESK